MNHKIITEIYSLVQIMEQKDKDGRVKKEEVIATLKCLIGEEEFIKTEDTLNYILETVIFISRVSKVAELMRNLSVIVVCKVKHAKPREKKSSGTEYMSSGTE